MGAHRKTGLLLAATFASIAFAQEKETTTLLMDLSTGRPIVSVFINGDGPFRFVFDTASTHTFVSADLVQRLRLPKTGTTIVSAPGSESKFEAPKANIKELRCGNFKFFDRSVVALADRAIFSAIRADGVMSLTDFDGYIVTVDLPGKRLVIEEGALGEEGSSPMEFAAGVPGIDIDANGKKVFCVLDTGSPFFIALPLKSPGGGKNRGVAASVTGRFPFVEATFDGIITIGDIALTNPVVQMLRGMPYGNLGSGFFARCVVSFDMQSSRVRFAPIKTP